MRIKEQETRLTLPEDDDGDDDKNGDKTNCCDYRSLSILSITYKILPAILLSKLITHAEDITGYHQRGFRLNRSTTHHIF